MRTEAVSRERLAIALAADAQYSSGYLVLVVASAAIATFGLLENNAAVIIGAMIIAPLIGPIQALSFGAIAGERGLLSRGIATLAIGTFVAIVIAAILEIGVSLPPLGSEIRARATPTLLDLGIAIAAGTVCGFARVRPSISATVAGTAIAVALMPPLCVIGIALASREWHLALGAFLLYVTNLLGITLSCMIVYRIAGHVTSTSRRALVTAVVLTAIVASPLGAALVELLRFERIEGALRSALVERTVTFKHVEFVQMKVDWLQHPPVATLTVRSTEPITPSQVHDLEVFAERETRQTFILVFEVTPLVEVKSATPEPL